MNDVPNKLAYLLHNVSLFFKQKRAFKEVLGSYDKIESNIRVPVLFN